MIHRLRARHLQLLQILGEVTTTHAAAERMHLSQPAITRMLREIEDIFEGPLFERTSKGVVANRAGMTLINQATVLMNELTTIEKEVRYIRQGQMGLLNIGALSGNLNATHAVARLLEIFPDVHISIREGQINLLIAALLNGELDCVIGPVTDEDLKNERVSQLRLEHLVEDSMAVVARAGNPLCRRKKIKWPDLSEYRWILPPTESVLRRAFMRTYMELGMSPPTHNIEAISPLTTRSLITSGVVDLGLLRMAHAREEARLGGLQILSMISDPPLPPLTLIARRSPRLRPELLDQFMAIAKETSAIKTKK